MRVKVTATFRWSPDGNTVSVYRKGEVLDGRAAAVAFSMGRAELVRDEEKPAAPSNRAVLPPKNRSEP